MGKLKRKTKKSLTIPRKETKSSCISKFDFVSIEKEKIRLIYCNCWE